MGVADERLSDPASQNARTRLVSPHTVDGKLPADSYGWAADHATTRGRFPALMAWRERMSKIPIGDGRTRPAGGV